MYRKVVNMNDEDKMWTKVTVQILDMGDGMVFAVSVLEGPTVK